MCCATAGNTCVMKYWLPWVCILLSWVRQHCCEQLQPYYGYWEPDGYDFDACIICAVLLVIGLGPLQLCKCLCQHGIFLHRLLSHLASAF
jgi:hypothetical protein